MSLPSEIFVVENNQLIMLKMRMKARVMVTTRMYDNEDKGKGKNIDSNYILTLTSHKMSTLACSPMLTNTISI